MIRNRIILAVLWIISIVGISFFGGPVSYGFFAVVTLIPVLCLIYLMLVLIRFKMYQYFACPKIVANHIVPFYFTLQNEDLFTFSGIRVTFYSDHSVIDGVNDETEYELLPRTKIRKETNLLCKYRGEYNVGIKSVILRDFLCLFKITFKNREPLKASVVPDIITLESLKSFDITSVSDRNSLKDQSIPDITVRDYIPGDDMRRIHWKQTARTGKLLTRNYTGEEKNGVGIFIDTKRISEKINIYLPVENRILETAIALALFFQEKRIPVSAYYDTGELNENIIDSSDTFQSFYQAMSALIFDQGRDTDSIYGSLTSFNTIFTKRIVFLITADLNDAALMLSSFLNDNECDVVIYHVNDTKDDAATVNISPHTMVMKIPTDGKLTELL